MLTCIPHRYTTTCAHACEVEVVGEEIGRDAVKSNIPLLKIAAEALGFRVGVHTCTVHVQALYDFMKIPVPRSFG